MQITFKPVTVKDAETLVAFERKVADRKLYGPPLDLQGAIKEIGKNTFYFIKKGDSVVGTAAYRVTSEGTIYISNVAIAPAFRRLGIARTTILFILQKCEGVNRAELVTHPENIPAIELYSSLGFRAESRVENYFGDGAPRLIFVLAWRSRSHYRRSGRGQSPSHLE